MPRDGFLNNHEALSGKLELKPLVVFLIVSRIELRVVVGARRAVPSRLDSQLSAELSAKNHNILDRYESRWCAQETRCVPEVYASFSHCSLLIPNLRPRVLSQFGFET